MTSRVKIIGKTIIAVVLGEVALISLTTFAQEVIYNGISFNSSPLPDIIVGGLLTMLAAVLSGMITSYVAGKSNHWPHVFISIIIAIEMTYLISSGITEDPLWFDVLAGLSLVAGLWMGYLVGQKLNV